MNNKSLPELKLEFGVIKNKDIYSHVHMYINTFSHTHTHAHTSYPTPKNNLYQNVLICVPTEQERYHLQAVLVTPTKCQCLVWNVCGRHALEGWGWGENLTGLSSVGCNYNLKNVFLLHFFSLKHYLYWWFSKCSISVSYTHLTLPTKRIV